MSTVFQIKEAILTYPQLTEKKPYEFQGKVLGDWHTCSLRCSYSILKDLYNHIIANIDSYQGLSDYQKKALKNPDTGFEDFKENRCYDGMIKPFKNDPDNFWHWGLKDKADRLMLGIVENGGITYVEKAQAKERNIFYPGLVVTATCEVFYLSAQSKFFYKLQEVMKLRDGTKLAVHEERPVTMGEGFDLPINKAKAGEAVVDPLS